MSAEDSFFSDTAVAGEGHPVMSPGGGFDSGSPPAAYSMPEPTAYGGEGQFNTMSQAMDGMPAPSYQSRPTDPYSLEETAGAMELVNSQFEATVKERADNEATQAEEVKRRAEEELDGFYDERTDEVARRQARSREQEEAFLRGVNASVEESSSNPWARVCNLVDLKSPVLPASSSSRGGTVSRIGSRRGSAAATGLEGEDAFRATEKMRSLIIQMKADTTHDNADDDTG